MITNLVNFLSSVPNWVILTLGLLCLLGAVHAIFCMFFSESPIDPQDYNWDVPRKKTMAEREHELECKFFQKM